MADNDQDRMRRQIAWIVTAVWVLSWPVSAALPDFNIIYAQAPMMLVMGWLFTAPLIRRNGGSE